MSETVAYKGILKFTGQTLEEYMAGTDTSDYENVRDCFDETFYGFAVVIDGEVYSVDKKELSLEDIAEAEFVEGSKDINFFVSYYNGGCSFDEAIEFAVNKMIDK